jgi:hypothetical protein
MSACRHHDIQKFDKIRCCLSCGEAMFENEFEKEQNLDSFVSLPYQYRRLNYELRPEVRLVVLHQGQKLDDITCDVIHVNLLNKPAYEAVSYTWATADGDHLISSYISCRDGEIAITKNCESVIRCLRRWGCKRIMWLDAIYINQLNNFEKATRSGSWPQSTLMRRKYWRVSALNLKFKELQ